MNRANSRSRLPRVCRLLGLCRITTSDRLEVLRGAPGHIEHIGRWCACLKGAASVILDVIAHVTHNIDGQAGHAVSLHEQPERCRHNPDRSPNRSTDGPGYVLRAEEFRSGGAVALPGVPRRIQEGSDGNSRASAQTTLSMLTTARVVSDERPEDPTARHVVLLDADADQVASLRAKLPPDSILEPAIRRKLHTRIPIEAHGAFPRAATAARMRTSVAKAKAKPYTIAVTGGGKPLAGFNVMFYLRDPGGQIQTDTMKTDARGKVLYTVPAGFQVAFVEPIPYAGFWIMFSEAPPSGSTIDCLPIPKVKAGGSGWWHEAMGIDVKNAKRGAGIKVGVIDTGCGPHAYLKHVTLVGAFVDGKILAANQATDVVEHGTHTTGIIGARPTKATDFAGIAAGCDLFHARVFKGEGPGYRKCDRCLIPGSRKQCAQEGHTSLSVC
jgi:hypothetical protein